MSADGVKNGGAFCLGTAENKICTIFGKLSEIGDIHRQIIGLFNLHKASANNKVPHEDA